MTRIVLRIAAAAIATASLTCGVHAVETPRPLKWSEMMPPAPPPVPGKPSTFRYGTRPFTAAPAPTPSDDEDERWMSERSRQPRAELGPQVVSELNGERIKIGGYVVPLDFEATEVKEFLLVPFVGACVHVPPPPANQIIYVKASEGFQLSGIFDLVTVTGTLKTEAAGTDLATAGYSLDAETVVAGASKP